MRNCCPHNTHTHSRSQPSDHSADDDDKAATAMPLLVLITIIYSLYPQGSYYISANYCIGIASSTSSTNGSASGRMCVVAHSSTRLCPINKAHNFLQHDLLELHYRLIAVGLYSNRVVYGLQKIHHILYTNIAWTTSAFARPLLSIVGCHKRAFNFRSHHLILVCT